MTVSAAEPSRAQKLHALSGIVPVGVFLVIHILTNARALSGAVAFDRASGFWAAFPLRFVLELLFVLVPLAFHAGYGVAVMVSKDRASTPSPYPHSWRVLSRGAAWVSLVFIVFHAYALALPRWTGAVGPERVHGMLEAHLSNATGAGGLLMPWTAIFYLVGLAATTVHFAAGTWGYLVRTNRASTSLGRRRAAYASGAVGTLLFALASVTVISLATGSPVFAAPAESPACPAPLPQTSSAPAPTSASAGATPAPRPTSSQ